MKKAFSNISFVLGSISVVCSFGFIYIGLPEDEWLFSIGLGVTLMVLGVTKALDKNHQSSSNNLR